MVEVPAAIFGLPMFTSRLDFLSIGTNDLIQYALAIDRVDPEVAHLYNPLHPAILSMISMTIWAADKAGIPVSICGEVAGDPALTRLLLGMGLGECSLHPDHHMNVKQAILSSDVTLLKPKVDKILTMVEEDDIENAVRQLQDDAKNETDA